MAKNKWQDILGVEKDGDTFRRLKKIAAHSRLRLKKRARHSIGGKI
jgi:hypothetical protein